VETLVMFARLEKTFEKPLYAITDPLKSFKGDNGKGIDYKKIWSPEAEKLYGILPRRYWQDFHLTIMTIDCIIPPHTDTEIITSINFYLQTEGCKTVFYKPKSNNLKTIQVKNQTNGHIYFEEDLIEVDSFIAKDFEVWLLDVTQIHGVQGNFNLRKALTLGTFIHKYEDVLKMLKETGNGIC
jgi:hypothetical protein